MSMDFSPCGLGLSLLKTSERHRDRDARWEKTVGAQETEYSHQGFLITMGMPYIVIHFLLTFPLFLFWDDPMREEKCCALDSR